MTAISFKAALGVHEQALLLRGERAKLLANNLANADTPNFRARDLDFKAIIQGQVDAQEAAPLRQTHRHHIAGAGPLGDRPGLLYRAPTQPSIDGNTVDEQLEMAQFARNTIEFNASFRFLNGKLTGLSSALRGE